METEKEPSKQALRAALKARLKQPVPEEAVAALRTRLDGFLLPGAYEALVAFVPIAGEPAIRPSLAEALADGMALFLPRYNGGRGLYELVRVANLEADLVTGHYGIDEPRADLASVKSLPSKTLWLIPGLAFDPLRGIRLGRGGGFYDRLLEHYPIGFRLGVAWDFQIRNGLPAESHDQPVDAILTDAALYECPRVFHNAPPS